MIRRAKRYPSDMSNKEWKLIKPLLPPKADNQQNNLRRVVDAMVYID